LTIGQAKQEGNAERFDRLQKEMPDPIKLIDILSLALNHIRET